MNASYTSTVESRSQKILIFHRKKDASVPYQGQQNSSQHNARAGNGLRDCKIR